MHIIGGLYRNRTIMAPKGMQTRPTAGSLRESLFNICQQYIQGAHFLDLFAGSGAMGLEALSRGASHAFFIDTSREAIRCIKDNIKNLGLEKQTTVLFGDVFYHLQKLQLQKIPFDIIYADPPYGMMSKRENVSLPYSHQVLQAIDTGSLLHTLGKLFIEEAKEIEMPSTSLKNLSLKNSRHLGRSTLYQYERIYKNNLGEFL